MSGGIGKTVDGKAYVLVDRGRRLRGEPVCCGCPGKRDYGLCKELGMMCVGPAGTSRIWKAKT